ncbi:MAG: hypothetical protein WA705_31145 [Candidatus Ozemobacteraceae bacterium]
MFTEEYANHHHDSLHGDHQLMKLFDVLASSRLRRKLLSSIVLLTAVFLAGCSDSKVNKNSTVNPIAAYQPTTTTTDLPTDGTTQSPGAIDTPIVTIPQGSDSTSHTNAPLLDNMHPGWQQNACFSCHSDQSRIPDHSYADTSLCYLCHGTNGLPGHADNVPPVIRGVTAAPSLTTVAISWSTDEVCISRLIIRTKDGDRLEFPVSAEYSTSHRYTVDSLISQTTYTYEIIATDRSNNVSSTSSIGQFSFTTLTEIPASSGTITGARAGGETETEVPLPELIRIIPPTAEGEIFKLEYLRENQADCVYSTSNMSKDHWHFKTKVKNATSTYEGDFTKVTYDPETNVQNACSLSARALGPWGVSKGTMTYP